MTFSKAKKKMEKFREHRERWAQYKSQKRESVCMAAHDFRYDLEDLQAQVGKNQKQFEEVSSWLDEIQDIWLLPTTTGKKG